MINLMKLLQKSDVAKAKSLDRQREIDQGVQLAKRVDSLRETVAQEEASLEKYRKETLTTIQAQITAQADKLGSLTSEVTELEYRKKLATDPIDTQWKELTDAQKAYQEKTELLDKRKAQLDTKDTELSYREQLAIDTGNVINLKLQDADRRLAESATLRDSADRQNTLASETLRKAEEVSSLKIASATRREENVIAREATAFAKEEELRKKEIELANEWTLLKDRQETFIRLSK